MVVFTPLPEHDTPPPFVESTAMPFGELQSHHLGEPHSPPRRVVRESRALYG
jgi:hypothetical protein